MNDPVDPYSVCADADDFIAENPVRLECLGITRDECGVSVECRASCRVGGYCEYTPRQQRDRHNPRGTKAPYKPSICVSVASNVSLLRGAFICCMDAYVINCS